METGTKFERDEGRVVAAAAVVVMVVMAMEERRSRMRMSGMPEWEQTLRMRNQRQLNNLQDKTKLNETYRAEGDFLGFFCHSSSPLECILFKCAPHPLWADYKSWTHPIYIVYANQVCLPIRLTFSQHKNTYHSIYTYHLPPRTFNFFHDIFINPQSTYIVDDREETRGRERERQKATELA